MRCVNEVGFYPALFNTFRGSKNSCFVVKKPDVSEAGQFFCLETQRYSFSKQILSPQKHSKIQPKIMLNKNKEKTLSNGTGFLNV